MARYIANAGALYTYICRGLAVPLGVAGAWVALVAYNALQVGLYGAAGVAAAPLFRDWFGVPVAWWVIALVAWAPVAMLGLLYVDVSGKVLAALLSAEVVVIMVYGIGDLTHPADGSITYDMLAPATLDR